MYCVQPVSKHAIDPAVYLDKVLGCWLGKNIGGTFGAPFEFSKEMNNAEFYVQALNGAPAPNDDLDLQLIWLLAAEERGIYHLDERVLGAYFLSFVTGPWNEYGVSKTNMRGGLVPPLSGSVNNDRWKNSNGAWIRSEIWACLFPGSPDEAVRFAWYDSCCDHAEEGIYAELFTAAVESAAFVMDDIPALIEIGLSRIPEHCRIARSIRLVRDSHAAGVDFRKVRAELVRLDADIGMFQAPANLGYVAIGLLYGEGDFGKSLACAVNCGDDADCTAGTVGALLGILKGRSALPEKWTRPIGNEIRTCSISVAAEEIPKTVGELTARVAALAHLARQENPALLDFRSGGTLPDTAELRKNDRTRKHIWTRSSGRIHFPLEFIRLLVEYPDGPVLVPGRELRLKIGVDNSLFEETVAGVRLLLPDGWKAAPADEIRFHLQRAHSPMSELRLTPGEFSGAFCYLPLEVRLSGLSYPQTVQLPFQKAETVNCILNGECREFYENRSRRRCRGELNRAIATGKAAGCVETALRCNGQKQKTG